MNTTGNTLKNRLIWLLLAVLLIASTMAAAAAEETFDVLQIGTRMYTNVTVTTKAKTYVFIMHSAGMTNVKVQDLPREVQQKLGYLAADIPHNPGEVSARGLSAAGATSKPGKFEFSNILPWMKQKLSLLKPMLSNDRMQQAREKLEKTLHISAQGGIPNLRSLNPKVVYAVLGFGLVFFVFFSYCSKLICLKAGTEPGALIWVPLFQLIPMLRAARMSAAWFLTYFVPVLSLVPSIIWCFKIAKARNKSVGVGILLLLPVLNLLAFLYLAFSSGEDDNKENKGKKKSGSQVMVLGAA